MERERIEYTVGSLASPGSPFGQSKLVIEVDGHARLDQHTRGGQSAWTGVLDPTARELLWADLEQAGFPSTPELKVPAGSALRTLTIGGEAVHIPFHAADKLPGYASVFRILDAVIRQISEDTPPAGDKIVDAIAHVPA